MRNLKRVLSLALASAMLLGMMVMGAGAADTKKPLTDLDKITNKEAVNLMVDLGIITGKPDGSYAPTETVDRATMSTLIYKIMMGTTDPSAFKGVNTGLKDVPGTWAEGYINYCYSIKILTGDGAGSFFPANKVTVAAAAKMLLVTLGYDADASKYQNDAMWSVNIMRDAQSAGLLAGIDQKATDELTRDNAAQMIYNTLNAYTVKPDFQIDMGVKYLKKYDADKTTLGYQTYGLIRLEATVNAIVGGKASSLTALTKDKDDTLVSVSAYQGKLPATPDMAGNKVTFFVKGTLNADGKIATVGDLISTTLAYTPFKLLGKSTNGTMINDPAFNNTDSDHNTSLTNKGSKNTKFIAELENATPANAANKYFVNGVSDEYADAEAAATKSGAIVELFDSNSNGLADIIKVTEKTVDFVTGAVKMGKNSDDKETVTVPGVVNATVTTNVVGYEGLEKGDVVLTVTIDGVVYIEKAATVEGVVTSIKGSTYKVDGTFYGLSGLDSSRGVTGFTSGDFKNTYKLYLDDNKNIVDVLKVTEESVAKNAVVLDFGKVSGSGIGGTTAFQAQVLKDDATVEIVNITKWNGLKIVDKESASDASATEIQFSNSSTNSAANRVNHAGNKGVFVTYKIDSDGKYELTKVVDKDEDGTADDIVVTAISADTEIKNNTAKFDGTNLANSKTTFLVKKGAEGKETYAVYTGIANVPSISSGSGNLTAGQVVSKGGVATYVFLDTVKVKGDVAAAKYAYILSETYETVSDGKDGVNYVFPAIIDGEVTTLTTGTAAYITTPVTDKGLVSYVTTDGIVSEAVSVITTATGITASSGVIVLGEDLTIGSDDKDTFLYDADTIIYVIDGKTVSTIEGSDISADTNDEVFVTLVNGTTNDTAAYVYIVKVAGGEA